MFITIHFKTGKEYIFDVFHLIVIKVFQGFPQRIIVNFSELLKYFFLCLIKDYTSTCMNEKSEILTYHMSHVALNTVLQLHMLTLFLCIENSLQLIKFYETRYASF